MSINISSKIKEHDARIVFFNFIIKWDTMKKQGGVKILQYACHTLMYNKD